MQEQPKKKTQDTGRGHAQSILLLLLLVALPIGGVVLYLA